MMVKINLLWCEIREMNATFRPASTGLDHSLGACDCPKYFHWYQGQVLNHTIAPQLSSAMLLHIIA